MAASTSALFYDSACALCSACAAWLRKHDRRHRLRLYSLDEPTAQALLRRHHLSTVDFPSVLFVKDWEAAEDIPVLAKSDAVLAAVATLGGIWRWVICLKVVPRRWRDAAYDRVARHRRRISERFLPISSR